MILTLIQSSEETTGSIPGLRANLLNTPNYMASDDFMKHAYWAKGNPDVLMWKDEEVTLDVQATCAVLGKVSMGRFFLEPQGNYNPKYDTRLHQAKLQFQILAIDDPILVSDFKKTLNTIEHLQTDIAPKGPKGEHFIVLDDNDRALRFSCPLFTKRASFFIMHEILYLIMILIMQKTPYDRNFFVPSLVSDM